MATQHCTHCGTVVLSHNRICPRCGHGVNARKLPVFWFIFMAGLFVTYACMDFMKII